MDFVINEWLLNYFLPGANKREKKQLFYFLQRFEDRRDRIVVLRPSPFTAKLDVFANLYSRNQTVYPLIKRFITGVLLNPSRATLISINEPLPYQTLAVIYELGTNYQSDEYLFHAALRTESKLIITTDEKLCRAMVDDQVFKVVLLTEFLKTY